MKNRILFIIVLISSFCNVLELAAQNRRIKKSRLTELKSEREIIESEIYSFYNNIVTNVRYDNEFNDIWAALQKVIIETGYQDRLRESESKGYIEAKAIGSRPYITDKTDLLMWEEFVTVEILGDNKPYTITFAFTGKMRYRLTSGTYSDWENYTPQKINSKQMQISLYQILKGEINLPEDLALKVADFNTKCEVFNLKLIKGKDYL
jgi:hypothetical protein